MKELYSQVLELFYDPESARELVQHPHNGGGRTWATTGTTLVSVPTIGEYPEDQFETIRTILEHPNTNIKIDLQQLRDWIDDIPVKKVNNNVVTCDACDGFGEVDYVFEHDGEEYTLEADCPVCDGQGTYEDEENPDWENVIETRFLKMYGQYYICDSIKKLVDAADILKETECTITFIENVRRPTTFKIGECEIYLMSANRECINAEDIDEYNDTHN